jgi:tRNA(Ile)-lysidine synthase
MPPRWSPFHLRLHRLLLQRPALLPRQAPLLVAVSGGQDSMALAGLLLHLQRLHLWQLHLWHGDHGWRPESARQAAELAAWARARGVSIRLERREGAATRSEARARQWRYACLGEEARRLGAPRVLTAHTATDRAETLLLNLARGCHRRGLASLPLQRELAAGIALVRPLLGFSRDDTAAICAALELPVWDDPSNRDLGFSRNRVRWEVIPVLEALHPGAARRLAATAERLAVEQAAEPELLDLALLALGEPDGPGLRRRALLEQAPALQARLLHHFIRRRTGRALGARPLELLLRRLAADPAAGVMDLAAGWQLGWDRSTLHLRCPSS